MAKLYRVLREPDGLAGFIFCRFNFCRDSNRGEDSEKHGRAAGNSSRGCDASQESPTLETFRFVLIHMMFLREIPTRPGETSEIIRSSPQRTTRNSSVRTKSGR